MRFINSVIILMIATPCFAGENVTKERYSEAALRYDPEVLIATAKHSSGYTDIEYKAREEDSVVSFSDKTDVIVKTQWCDEISCTEWKDNDGE